MDENLSTCTNCGARLHPGADWCGQCQQSVVGSDPRFAAFGSAPGFNRGATVSASVSSVAADRAGGSRWKSSDLTFGPLGRLIITILVILPAIGLLAVALFSLDLSAFIGLGLYGFVILPWALRDTWRRA